MARRLRFYEVDWSNFDSIVKYAYGRKMKIKSQTDITRMFLEIKERISRDKIEIFRQKHDCKECYLFKNNECKANGYCRFDKQRRLVYKSKINGCPHNNNEPCCFANEVGTCFGFCYKDQLRESHSKEESLKARDASL